MAIMDDKMGQSWLLLLGMSPQQKKLNSILLYI